MRALLCTGLLALLAGCDHPPAAHAPPPPDNLGARSLGVRGIELGWRDRSDSTAWFAIERLDPGQETYTRAGLRPPGETQWVEWGLEPDSAYRYRVISATDSGLSKPSDPIEVKLPPTRIPEPRVEVFDPMAVSPGVTLFNVEDYHDVASVSVVMAVDMHGTVLWHLEHTGLLVTETDLFPGGDVLVQVGPVVSRLDRKGDVVIYLDQYFLHHDIDVLPWGNLIAITSRSVKDKQEFPTDLYSREDIVEVVPETGEIVWRLAFEDLLPTSEICPACITTGVVGGQDWIHLNALDYDLDEEALYVSVRNSNRIYKLSFPLGEVDWIMGDGGDFGQDLFDHQHNPYRIAPNTFLVFDNGLHSDPLTPDRSRVIEIEYDPSSLSSRIVWQYDGPPSFYSEAQGDASRLPNGNTLIVDSAGPRILEITRQGLPVWELTLPKPYVIYKAHRIENFP
jgi:hypothetical protein